MVVGYRHAVDHEARAGNRAWRDADSMDSDEERKPPIEGRDPSATTSVMIGRSLTGRNGSTTARRSLGDERIAGLDHFIGAQQLLKREACSVLACTRMKSSGSPMAALTASASAPTSALILKRIRRQARNSVRRRACQVGTRRAGLVLTVIVMSQVAIKLSVASSSRLTASSARFRLPRLL